MCASVICVWVGGGVGEEKKKPGKMRGDRGHKELIWGRSGTLRGEGGEGGRGETAQHTTLTRGEETKKKITSEFVAQIKSGVG